MAHTHTHTETHGVPAHLVAEAVSLGHTLQLMLVFLEQVNVALLGDKLQQLNTHTERSAVRRSRR